MLGAEKPLALNLHGKLEEPGKDRPDILRATLNQLFHQTVERRIVPLVHSWISIGVSQLHGIPKRDSPGRGRPSQGAQRKSQINFQTSGYSTEDAALPSGNGVMLQVLAQLYHLTGESLYRERAEGIAKAFSGVLRQRVLGFSSLLNGMEMLREAVQIVLIGEPNAEDTVSLTRVIYGVSQPGRIFSVIAPGTRLPRVHPAFGKTSSGQHATAYVCRGMVCSLPIVDPEALAAALREA
jgi:uncharacterized protein YyaL (SSP411 family)